MLTVILRPMRASEALRTPETSFSTRVEAGRFATPTPDDARMVGVIRAPRTDETCQARVTRAPEPDEARQAR
jgi:hypothetical protein